MGPIGMQEMIALFVIALLLFGPKKLPELGKTLGKALSEFRRAKNELKATFESHMNEIERETRLESSNSASATPYSYPYDDYGQQGYSHGSSSTEQISSAEPSSQLPAPPAESSVNGTAGAASETAARAPVADTVPRSNGVQPLTVPADKGHQD
jgi:sec-independent protein translocase protein TatA